MAAVQITKKTVVYVGGLEASVDQAHLQAMFIPFGDIVQVVIPRDEERGKGHDAMVDV